MQKLLRQKWTWFVGLLLMVILSASVSMIWSSAKRSKITHKNYKRIQVGMTLTEVEGILGDGRHADYPIIGPTSWIQVHGEPPRVEGGLPEGTLSAWTDEAASIILVMFDKTGKVQWSSFQQGRISFMERTINAAIEKLGL